MPAKLNVINFYMDFIQDLFLSVFLFLNIATFVVICSSPCGLWLYQIFSSGSIVLLRHCKRTEATGTLSSTAVDKIDPTAVSSPYYAIKQTFADQTFCPEWPSRTNSKQSRKAIYTFIEGMLTMLILGIWCFMDFNLNSFNRVLHNLFNKLHKETEQTSSCYTDKSKFVEWILWVEPYWL
jgi:hypothetical protein